ncbi:Protein of unknown function [Propionibacterium freudenreichii]|nr:Protein of unknown function [Propionibacterium freudenreichii subsp. freudenreichii]CEG91423.1 Protein of unknown function [Propionibacterium freudenreichii]CEG96124.1 Protein of unknown function [Propionibacterium freudenreichii]CEH00237.1 Protein of unknown function [Propionibacterium freudenreichii]CEH04448.1 Protein of unknown function [Propionibacterium freudenreichii]
MMEARPVNPQELP